MEEFKDKVVIVTGAANGIGRETVKQFANEGAKITLVDLKQEELEAAAQYANLKKGDYILAVTDVSREDQVKTYIEKTMATFGRIDVCAHVAGIIGVFFPVADYPTDTFMRVLNVNVGGVFLGMKHVLPIMLEQRKGSIVNVASIAGLKGAARESAYVASKFAINGLTRTAALEYAGAGIRINSICPGSVDTDMMRTIEKGTNRSKEVMEQYFPMKRYGSPLDMANVILFLASEKASYVTGSNYIVDGGFTA